VIDRTTGKVVESKEPQTLSSFGGPLVKGMTRRGL
jgi:hypothetical protein